MWIIWDRFQLMTFIFSLLYLGSVLAQDVNKLEYKIMLPEEGVEIMTLKQWDKLVINAPEISSEDQKNHLIKKLEANLALTICLDPSARFCGDKDCQSVTSYQFMSPNREKGLVLTSLSCGVQSQVDMVSKEDCHIEGNLDFSLAYLYDHLSQVRNLINTFHGEVFMSEKGSDFMKKSVPGTRPPEAPVPSGYLSGFYSGLGYITSSISSVLPQMATKIVPNVVESSLKNISNEISKGGIKGSDSLTSNKIFEMATTVGKEVVIKTGITPVAGAFLGDKNDNQDWEQFFNHIEEKYLGTQSKLNDKIKGKVNELFTHTKKEMELFKRDLKSQWADKLFRLKSESLQKEIEADKSRMEDEEKMLKELQTELQIRDRERKWEQAKEQVMTANKLDGLEGKISKEISSGPKANDEIFQKNEKFKDDDGEKLNKKINEINEARKARNSKIKRQEKKAKVEYDQNKGEIGMDFNFDQLKVNAILENKREHFSWTTVKTLSPLLYAKLKALNSLWKIPQEIRGVDTKKNILESLDKTLFLGTEGFFENTKDLSLETRNNMIKALDPSSARAKRIKMIKRINLGGGPAGTGKSHLATLLENELKIPVLRIIGNDFRKEIEKLGLKEDEDTFEPIKRLLEEKIIEASRDLSDNDANEGANPVRYRELVILCDDWDSLFTDAGPLSAKRLGGSSRRKFLHLLKEIGDVSQNGYFDIDLLEGEDIHPDIKKMVEQKYPTIMPLDSQLHTWYFTFNSIPEELDKNNFGPLNNGTDLDKEFFTALRSRVRDFLAKSPSPDDRRNSAKQLQNIIIQKIAQKANIRVKDVHDFKMKTGIDFEYCERKFDQIIEKDVWAQQVLDKNKRHLSIRPLVTMFISYSGLINDAIDMWEKDTIDKDLFKKIEFDVDQRMKGSNEYKEAIHLDQANKEGEKLLEAELIEFEKDFQNAELSWSKKDFFKKQYENIKSEKDMNRLAANIERLKKLRKYMDHVIKIEADFDSREEIYRKLKKKLPDYEITSPHFRNYDEALKQMERQVRYYLRKEPGSLSFEKKIIIVSSKREGMAEDLVKDLQEFYPSFLFVNGEAWNKELRIKLESLADYETDHWDYYLKRDLKNTRGETYDGEMRLDPINKRTGMPHRQAKITNVPKDMKDDILEKGLGVFILPRYGRKYNNWVTKRPLPENFEIIGDGKSTIPEMVGNHLDKFEITNKSFADILLTDGEDEITANDGVFEIELSEALLDSFKEFAIEKELISASGNHSYKFIAKSLVEFIYEQLNHEDMIHKNYHVFLVNKLKDESLLEDINGKKVVKVALGEVDLKNRKGLLERYVASKINDLNNKRKNTSKEITLTNREKDLIDLVIQHDSQQSERAFKQKKIQLPMDYAKSTIDIILKYPEKRTKFVNGSATIKLTNDSFIKDYILVKFPKYYKSDAELAEKARLKLEYLEEQERLRKEEEEYQKMLEEEEVQRKAEDQQREQEAVIRKEIAEKLKREREESLRKELEEKIRREQEVVKHKEEKTELVLELEAKQKAILESNSGLGVNFDKDNQ